MQTFTPPTIPPIDAAAIEQARAQQESLAKPPGSLGRLEEFAIRIAGIQATETPTVDPATIVTAVADHGVATDGVSAYPQSITGGMLNVLVNDRAAVNAIARSNAVSTIVCDFGVVDGEDAVGSDAYASSVIDCRIGAGTANMRTEPAMSRKAAVASIEQGRSVVTSHLTDAGCIGLGEMGIANSTAAAAITAVLTGNEVSTVTGRGTGVDDEGLTHKQQVIADAIETTEPDRTDPIDVLRCVGGYEIGGLVGVTIEAASRRIPVVIDGVITGAAALLAVAIDERVQPYLLPSHASVEPGHTVQLESLGVAPLFDYQMRLGEGTGAALAIATYRSACQTQTEMATIAELT